MVTSNKKQGILAMLLAVMMAVTMIMGCAGVGVFATTSGGTGTDPDDSYKNLTNNVGKFYQAGTGYGDYGGSGGDPTYELEDGGYVAYSKLFKQGAQSSSGGTTYTDLDAAQFNKLTNKAKNEAVKDIATATNGLRQKDEDSNATGGGAITDETVDTWWSNLQKKDGIGTRFLNSVLADTKPDFVTASKWYKPFSGPIGSLLAFISIVAMGLIGLVMGADILYITVPPFRLFVDDQGAEGKVQTSKIFSHAAIHAVKTVEEGGDNGNKAALGLYFKSRVIELVLLAICLLYLVNGQIYNLVSYILDLFSGIVG